MIVYGSGTTKRIEDTSYEIEIVGVPVEHFPYVLGVFVLGAYVGPILMLLSFVIFVCVSRMTNKQKKEGNILMGNEILQRIARRLEKYGYESSIEIENEVLDE